MLPIWLLYFFPFFVVPNYLLKLAFAGIGVCVIQKCIYRLNVAARTVLACWGLGILSELIGLGLFFVLEMNLPVEFYDQRYALWSILALLLAALVNMILNGQVAFREIHTMPRRLLASLLVTIAVAPYLFLLPQ